MSDAKYFRDLCSAIKQENEELKAETQSLRNKVEHLQEELVKFIDYVLEEELPHEVSWTYATALKERLNLSMTGDQGLGCAQKGITGFDFGVCEIESSYCHVKCCASCTFSSASFADYRCQVEYHCSNLEILQAAFERDSKKFDFVKERAKWIEVLPFGSCDKQEFREKLEMA